MIRKCKLHIGSGAKALDGWINIDIDEHPGVDVVADVTKGLHFKDVRAVYAEHFIEHLPVDLAIDFLVEVHRALENNRWLRLSTPNLEWIWITHYNLETTEEEKREMTCGANRAFYGWGHRFMWSKSLLEEALLSCGFINLKWCEYGKSKFRYFRNIEKHESYPDLPGAPHVIVIEAQKGEANPQRLIDFRSFIEEHFSVFLDWELTKVHDDKSIQTP